jgi:hypothetical protein
MKDTYELKVSWAVYLTAIVLVTIGLARVVGLV